MAFSSNTHINWSSRMSFLLASIGFSVGLGNIWRFPYVTGENGGAAFILVYLACALCIGVPLVMSEWALGRNAHVGGSAAASFAKVAKIQQRSSAWQYVGGMAVLAVFMMMLTYTVITGWTLEYFYKSVSGQLQTLDAQSSQSLFDSLMANPTRLLFWHTLVVILTVLINARGLHKGIEKAVKILMPSLFLSLILMVTYSFIVGDISQALQFLLTPDFSKISGHTFLLALGQAFFSIGIAMAVMVTYGAYLPKEASIPKNAFIVVFADTGIALLAGFAIFPLVFAHGMAPDAGAGLVFQVLPVAFSELPGGHLFSAVFFLLLIAAALTSCIGNFEPVVVWTMEKLNTSRNKAALIAGASMWAIGVFSVLSLNVMAEHNPLSLFPLIGDKSLFASFDYLSASILLPLGGLFTAIFVGWRVKAEVMQKELGLSRWGFTLWRWLIRIVVPIAILIVFVSGVTE